MKTQELIKKLNDLNITQKSIDFEEDIYEEDKELHEEFDHLSLVVGEFDIERHRWYDLGTTVYHNDEDPLRYIGVENVCDLKSEEMTVEDVYHTLRFFEMEEIKTVSYQRV